MSLLDADEFGGNWIFRFNQTLNFPLKFSSTMQNGACSSLVMAWVKMHKSGKSHLFPGNIKLPSYIKIVENLKATSMDGIQFLNKNGLSYRHGICYGEDNIVEKLATTPGGYEALAYVDHAVGLAVTLSGVDFFDPNFGCVHFPTCHNFRTWFKEKYWPNRDGIGEIARPCDKIFVCSIA
ncbi:YopT-type cysteine protease domain-containing protein [Xenorhabdus anantnagensis]|uniref:YopT-type cysteine protease domain-containing protein n=1 Tax=Xenorhabdus anantnagensis TaxID=3025875 RepID=A0ABT5LVP1_9GAMM|nr:YopT-type cysteine protease domain-containing protein [Xenorhabdus anantnagensis]MDC9598497.1 YopT-type cysteine protease domain-containing protein [Xenorhabdus anantnagensis]